MQYGLPLKILSYDELYGWTMDAVVAQVGRKNNCTFCGVFRRQALDRGAAALAVDHIVTGHNADDIAETVLMNSMRRILRVRTRALTLAVQSCAAISRGSDAARSSAPRARTPSSAQSPSSTRTRRRLSCAYR